MGNSLTAVRLLCTALFNASTRSAPVADLDSSSAECGKEESTAKSPCSRSLSFTGGKSPASCYFDSKQYNVECERMNNFPSLTAGLAANPLVSLPRSLVLTSLHSLLASKTWILPLPIVTYSLPPATIGDA